MQRHGLRRLFQGPPPPHPLCKPSEFWHSCWRKQKSFCFLTRFEVDSRIRVCFRPYRGRIGGIMCRGRGSIWAVVDGWRSLSWLQHYHCAVWQHHSHGAIITLVDGLHNLLWDHHSHGAPGVGQGKLLLHENEKQGNKQREDAQRTPWMYAI